MKKRGEIPKDYYKQTFCRRCKKEVSNKQLKKCQKERFLLLCEKCYPLIKEQLKKCLPLMHKFSQR